MRCPSKIVSGRHDLSLLVIICAQRKLVMLQSSNYDKNGQEECGVLQKSASIPRTRIQPGIQPPTGLEVPDRLQMHESLKNHVAHLPRLLRVGEFAEAHKREVSTAVCFTRCTLCQPLHTNHRKLTCSSSPLSNNPPPAPSPPSAPPPVDKQAGKPVAGRGIRSFMIQLQPLRSISGSCNSNNPQATKTIQPGKCAPNGRHCSLIVLIIIVFIFGTFCFGKFSILPGKDRDSSVLSLLCLTVPQNLLGEFYVLHVSQFVYRANELEQQQQRLKTKPSSVSRQQKGLVTLSNSVSRPCEPAAPLVLLLVDSLRHKVCLQIHALVNTVLSQKAEAGKEAHIVRNKRWRY